MHILNILRAKSEFYKKITYATMNEIHGKGKH